MSSSPRVLMLEDSPADAELIAWSLRRDGLEPAIDRVDNERAFVAALETNYDVILSDFELPLFDGLQALGLVRGRGMNVPFIMVSGTIGEDIAVEAMKRGASDYVMKNALGRLAAAIRQVLEQKQLRTEREKAEQALQASEQHFREVAETIREVFWIADVADFRILYVSPSYETVWGRRCAELLASSDGWLQSVYPEDRRRVKEARVEQAAGTYDLSYRILRPDSTLRWVRDRAYPVRTAAGEVIRVVGVAEDITERKELEAQFLRAQRLEAIGTLAGGMAHDLNNILAPMLMAAGLMRENAHTAHDREMLGMIERNAQRGASIIRQLLTFSRGIEGERRPIQLRHLAKEIDHIVRETFPRNITLVDDVPSTTWPVVADATQFHQVLMNLCVNARDAMPSGGRLTLAASNVIFDAAKAARHPGARAGQFVVFTVADTGFGMPPELIDHIFEPFFTTKEVGKGTGLGLSTVQGIVRSHGGFIEVESEIGRGSAFHAYFPAAIDSSAVPEPEAPRPSGRGNHELILVVDDEDAVRVAIQRVLENANYRVITARNGRDGIVEYLRHREAVRLVITDEMMPEVGGTALVRALQVLDAKTRFIAISGLDSQHEQLVAVGVRTILAKPCGPGVLLDAVRVELARR